MPDIAAANMVCPQAFAKKLKNHL